MEYRPIKRSLFISLIFALIPTITAGIITHLTYESANWFLWLMDAILVSFSIVLVAQIFYVYTLRVYIDDYRIKISSCFGTTRIKWSEATDIDLQSDCLLTIEYPKSTLRFDASILLSEDKERVIDKAKEKRNLIAKNNKESI